MKKKFKDKRRKNEITGVGRKFSEIEVSDWTSNQIAQYIRYKQEKMFFNYDKTDPEYYDPEYYDLGFGSQKRGIIWSKIKVSLVIFFKNDPEEVKNYIDWIFDTQGKHFEKPIPLGFILGKRWKWQYKNKKDKDNEQGEGEFEYGS